jgi:hypothetical protein
MHAHLIIPVAEIKLGEEACSLQLIQKLINNSNWALVLSFRALKSTQKHQVPSCFFTNRTGEEKGDIISHMILWPRISMHCHSI